MMNHGEPHGKYALETFQPTAKAMAVNRFYTKSDAKVAARFYRRKGAQATVKKVKRGRHKWATYSYT